MFSLAITNNYPVSITLTNQVTEQKQIIATGHSLNAADIGGMQTIDVPGIGAVTVFDLGEYKLPKIDHTVIPGLNATWGILIRYQADELYLRYEGSGVLNFAFDNVGTLNVTTTLTTIDVKLPGIVYNQS